MKSPDAIFKSRMRTHRIITVLEFDHAKKRVLVRGYPDSKPRWVRMSKAQVVA